MRTSTVLRLRPLRIKNRYLYAVDLACGHTMVIDVTLDDPAQFDRRCKVDCFECVELSEPEIGGEA